MTILKTRTLLHGSLASEFRIGKQGPTILQGSVTPDENEGANGDLYIRIGAAPRLYLKRDGDWVSSSDPSFALVPQAVNMGTATISAPTTYVGVIHTGGSTITLPVGTESKRLLIKDEGGNAYNNPIVVQRSGTDLIDGGTSFLIDQNYGFVDLLFHAGGWRVIAKSVPSIAAPLRRSDVLFVTNPATTTYSFQRNGQPMPLNADFIMVFLNRFLLRASEFSVANDQVAISATLEVDDELEVVTAV